MREQIEAALVANLLDYDPSTGLLTWRPREPLTRGDRNFNTRFAGKPAFTSQRPDGYFEGAIHNRLYRAHRVAWAVVHGVWPDKIDHINGDRSDNRLTNLRSVTVAENCLNLRLRSSNKSGRIGVSWFARDGKWRASGYINRRVTNLGHFDDLNEAIAVRERFERDHGYHSNHGRALHVATGEWLQKCADIRAPSLRAVA